MWKRKNKGENIHLLPTEKIFPNPWQARKNFPEEELGRLSASILRYGMLQPLTVQEKNGEYELVFGERRLRAAKMLEMKTVPCRVVELGPRSAAEMVLVENLIRQDLDFFEEAAALERLLQHFSYTQAQLAGRLGMSQSALANKLRLLKFTPEERIVICEKGLSQRHARALLQISEPRLRRFALSFVGDKGYTVRQTEEFISHLLSHPEEFVLGGEKPRLKPHPVRRLVVKDVRLFINSVDKAIYSIREAGFSVEAEKEEEEAFIRYSIRVPKYSKT